MSDVEVFDGDRTVIGEADFFLRLDEHGRFRLCDEGEGTAKRFAFAVRIRDLAAVLAERAMNSPRGRIVAMRGALECELLPEEDES